MVWRPGRSIVLTSEYLVLLLMAVAMPCFCGPAGRWMIWYPVILKGAFLECRVSWRQMAV